LSNPRYIPDFRLRINDAPISHELRASITNVTLSVGLEGADRIEFQVINENLRWLDHSLLRLKNPVGLQLGYLPDAMESMFHGEITGVQSSFPSDGVPVLTVTAQDRLWRTKQSVRSRWFPIPVPSVTNLPMPDQTVASTVSNSAQLEATFDPIGAALAAILGVADVASAAADPDGAQGTVRKQIAETDFNFLRRLAKQNGWEMVVDHSSSGQGRRLRFFSPLDELSPKLTLKYGSSLIDFTPRESDVGQVQGVTANIWLPSIKMRFQITVLCNFERGEISIEVQPEGAPRDTGDSILLIYEPLTVSTAPRRILEELMPRLNQRMTGSGSTVGETRIRAGEVLRLDGLGVQFGGLWRVTSATHTVNSGGYLTRFEARKEIWFAKIPRPEQGAIAVRLHTPVLV
jgi:phage protein D